MSDKKFKGCMLASDCAAKHADIERLKSRARELEIELKTVTARYNCVRDMTPEDFGNLSSTNDDFDSQVDAMIKERSK